MPEEKGGGLLRRLTGARPGAISTGNNTTYARNQALLHTSGDSPGPAQPQNIVGLKTVPTLQQPHVWNETEALQAQEMARQMRQAVNYSKKGYDALKSVDDSEVKIEGMHYEYLEHLATNEVQRIRQRTGYVNKLSRLSVVLGTIEEKSKAIQADSEKRLNQRRNDIRARMGKGARNQQRELLPA